MSTAPARGTAAPAAGGQRQVIVILIALMLGLLLAALDQTIVSTALPTIVGDLGGLTELSWVVTAYLLASTASTPLWGKLGDLFGRKNIYLLAICVFLAGSALCGLSQNMTELIAFRGLQGLGGGGLMVTAQAIIADVVSARERGRYQGFFGAVFGVTSVGGPLLGGFLTEHASWRWVFYVNLPVGVIALLVIIAVLPGAGATGRPRIDYLGTLTIAAAASGFVLLTTWGGTTYAWASPQIVGLAIGGALLTGLFLIAESRAPEPLIPLRLFRQPVFSVTSAIGFVVGFAMFGAITFLPLYLQVVQGVSPTLSGVRLLPMMVGLLSTSLVSGQLISRTGRYKLFPILGTGVMSVGLFLLSRMDPQTSTLLTSVFMFVLGFGLGMVMQVLVIAVQNAVDYRDLGVATSGATFFRSIGSSFGVAVFGAIFANQLTANLPRYLPLHQLPAGLNAAALRSNPAALAKLPAAVHEGLLSAYSASISTIFLAAVPIGILAFVLTWFLPEAPLRPLARASDPGHGFATAHRNTEQEIARALSMLASREDWRHLYDRLAKEAGLDLDPFHCWLLARLDRVLPATAVEVAERLPMPLHQLEPALGNLAERGFLTSSGGRIELSQDGHAARRRMLDSRRRVLEEMLPGLSVQSFEPVAAAVSRLAGELLGGERGPRWERLPETPLRT
jgi:EmrB/QacA subfamily drug resistance transporter